MKQLSNQKQSIAWFKLHQFIQRGEKEKAINICKLLIPSINDHAFAYKLEGDLFYAFHDKKAALEKYFLAAQTYIQENRIGYAAELCNQLATEELDYLLLMNLTILYIKINDRLQADFFLNRCMDAILHEKNAEKIYKVLRLAKEISVASFNHMVEKTIFNLIAMHTESYVIEHILKNLVEHHMDHFPELPTFTAKLKAAHEEYYNFLVHLIEKAA